MKFYVDELPKSCCEDDCPFNYDGMNCRAMFMSDKEWEDFCQSGELDLLQEHLDGDIKARYHKCPLILLDKEIAVNKGNG